MSTGAFLIMLGFSIGVQLGWRSDWFRKLFRMGPYRRMPKVPYRWIDKE